jgi:hypothetical protein
MPGRQPVEVDNPVIISVTDEKTIQFSITSAGNPMSLSGDFLLHQGNQNTLNLQCAKPFKLLIVDFFDTTPGKPQGNPTGQHGKSCSAAECPVSAGAVLGPVFNSSVSGANNVLSLSLKTGGNKGVYKYSIVVDTDDNSVAAIDPQIIVN